jgi:2-iminobutanoate/2-iminopropanoate deaminase
MRAVTVDGLSSSPLSAATVSGTLVHTSGQVGREPGTSTLASGFEAQMRVALANLDAVLEAAGSSRAQVLKTVVLLVRREDFDAMNRLYAEHFDEPCPARSTIVCQLAHEALLFEIEAVAERADEPSAPGAVFATLSPAG